MRNLFVIAVSILLFTACRKEEPSAPQTENPKDEKNYMPLKIGNYWIYQDYSVDKSGAGTKQGEPDSVRVDSDTLINGQEYFILRGTDRMRREWGILDVLRDSSGYLLSYSGKIRFSENNFTDTLNYYVSMDNKSDTIYTLLRKMQKPMDSITVPAGTFEVLDARETVDFIMENPFPSPRYNHHYYANKIGLVKQVQIYFVDFQVLERRLIRYHVQE